MPNFSKTDLLSLQYKLTKSPYFKRILGEDFAQFKPAIAEFSAKVTDLASKEGYDSEDEAIFLVGKYLNLGLTLLSDIKNLHLDVSDVNFDKNLRNLKDSKKEIDPRFHHLINPLEDELKKNFPAIFTDSISRDLSLSARSKAPASRQKRKEPPRDSDEEGVVHEVRASEVADEAEGSNVHAVGDTLYVNYHNFEEVEDQENEAVDSDFELQESSKRKKPNHKPNNNKEGLSDPDYKECVSDKSDWRTKLQELNQKVTDLKNCINSEPKEKGFSFISRRLETILNIAKSIHKSALNEEKLQEKIVSRRFRVGGCTKKYLNRTENIYNCCKNLYESDLKKEEIEKRDCDIKEDIRKLKGVVRKQKSRQRNNLASEGIEPSHSPQPINYSKNKGAQAAL